jgi:hypothetical protein
MDKRDRFIAELRDEAKRRGLSFRLETRRGKGGHVMVRIGNRVTTLPSREIDPRRRRGKSEDHWASTERAGFRQTLAANEEL